MTHSQDVELTIVAATLSPLTGNTMANEIELAKQKECKDAVTVMLEIYGGVYGYELLYDVLKPIVERIRGEAAAEALVKLREKAL